MIALLACAPALARAQDAEPTPTPGDALGPSSPIEDPPAEAPADEPATAEEPAPAAAGPAEPPTPAEPKPSDGANLVAGLELGVGGIVSGGGVYHVGLGRGVVLGFRIGRFTLEWHFLQSYQARIDDELAAANTAHSLDISSYAIRFAATPMLSLFGGVVRAGIPVIRGTYNDVSDRWTIEPGTSDGMGPIVGVGVSKKFADDWVTLSAEARIGKIVVNDADPRYLTPTGPPDANGVIPVMMSTAELNPTIGMLLVGIRISPP